MEQGQAGSCTSGGSLERTCLSHSPCRHMAHAAHAGEPASNFSAIAIGALSLAISTVSIAKVTYEDAAENHLHSNEPKDLLVATHLGGAVHEAELAPALSQPLKPEASMSAAVASSEAHAQIRVAAPIELPRLNRCLPTEARFDSGVPHCPPRAEAPIEAAVSSPMAAGNVAGSAFISDHRHDGGQFAQVSREEAIASAEAAVLAGPDDAARRFELGSAYLQAGRYQSAATAFGDAVRLGDGSEQAILALAVSLAGAGQSDEAAALLTDNAKGISGPRLGIALALVGRPAQASKVLEDAIAQGADGMDVRQNLAYAYTLAGRWREARSMAEIDLDAAQAHRRIAHWLETSHSQATGLRIARHLHIAEAQFDPGQPEALAWRPAGTILADTPPSGESLDLARAGAGEAEAEAQAAIARADSASAYYHPATEDIAANGSVSDPSISEIAVHVSDGAEDSILLAELISALEGSMEGELFASLSASPGASELVTLDTLRSFGIDARQGPGERQVLLSVSDL